MLLISVVLIFVVGALSHRCLVDAMRFWFVEVNLGLQTLLLQLLFVVIFFFLHSFQIIFVSLCRYVRV